MERFTRRGLAKSLAMTGAAAALGHPAEAQPNGTVATSAQEHSSTWTEVLPGIWRARIGTPEAYTPVGSRLVPPATAALRTLPNVSQAPLPPLTGRVSDRGTMIDLPLAPQELVYGFGLQLLSFEQRGLKKTIRVNADPKIDTGDSHAPVPLYATTQGYAVLVDTARYADFYVGNARPKPDKPLPPTETAVVDPSDNRNILDSDPGRITVEIPRAHGVDVYLFAGPTMLDAVRRYNLFSGGGLVPPEWGLGFWYRCDIRSTGDVALALAREFRERNIPCDVWGLEPGWQTHAYSCTFAWDRQRFPDPSAFLKSMQGMHLHVNLWEHAFAHPTSPLFPALQSTSGDRGVWGGLVPDFAGSKARAAFGDYHGQHLIDAGVSGFKLDECDNSDFTGGWSFPEFSRFPSGIDGEQMHSVFGLRYQHTIWQQYQRRNLPTYNLVRSSGALATPYPFVLYSDLYGHRDFIRALVNSGFSGLLWCPEVRDATSEEDLLRRLQSVVFSPLAMVNGWYIKSPPWRQLDRERNNAGEAMPNWQQTEARCREIIGWRMSLVPYLIRAFQQYAADGTPPFRALVLDAPHDASLVRVDDQFLVGDRIMVAPMFAGEPERTVVIPAGEPWHDFWTGATVPGGTKLTVPHTFDKIPVYVRSGSIVPWAVPGPHAGAPESRQIVARVYGDGTRSFQFAGVHGATLHWSSGRGELQGLTDYRITGWQHVG